MSKLSDASNTALNSRKQQERFDDSKDIKKDRGACVVKKHNKLGPQTTVPTLKTLLEVFRVVTSK